MLQPGRQVVEPSLQRSNNVVDGGTRPPVVLHAAQSSPGRRNCGSIAVVAGSRRQFVFDPVAVGRAECDAWAAYYRRDWVRMLIGAFRMIRHGFALGPVGDLVAAWHVMRANRAWAPSPDNDPEAARQHMTRFYALADRAGRISVDPAMAARLEVGWWRVHRQHQHDASVDRDLLVSSLVLLYAYVHGADPAEVQRAAERRVEAMDLSDAWVRNGCKLDDPLLRRERLALVASFSALREATDRAQLRHSTS